MRLQVVLPAIQGRGSGLGNEMIVWAKALVIGQTLGIKCLHPAWGLNHRKYYQYFGTSRFDFILYFLLKNMLPTFEFKEKDYLECGGGTLPDAIRNFALKHNLSKRRFFIILVSGMWGGFDLLNTARQPLLSKLSATRRTAENLAQLDAAIPPEKLRVGVHIRRGDFGNTVSAEQAHGKFNVAISLNWYESILRNLTEYFGDSISFVIFSDAKSEELQEICNAPNVYTTSNQHMNDVSDLLALVNCDLIVCSISSFSLWATFLSRSMYVWYRPQLTEISRHGGIWAHESLQCKHDSPTMKSLETVELLENRGERIIYRGVAVDTDGQLPSSIICYLENELALKRRESDIVRYGVTQMNYADSR